MALSEYLFIAAFFGLPALAGAWLARAKGKNPLLWGLLSLLFPFCVFILWMNSPAHEVTGYYRKCRACGRVYPWKLDACKYCGVSKESLTP